MAVAASLLERLKDRSLVVETAFIGGRPVAAGEAKASFDVIDPATGERLATLPDLGRAEAAAAIEAAAAAQRNWAARTGKERAGLLRRLHDLMVAMPTTSPPF